MILEEFDKCRNSMINPWDIVDRIEGMPKVALTCFERRTFSALAENLSASEIASVSCANMVIPVYKATVDGTELALFNSYVGSAGCVGLLEEIFAMGVEKLVMFGTCGVLDPDIEDCSVIIPTSAVRDEGTSYHYAPPSDEIEVNRKYTDDFRRILDSHGCRYTQGKVWTTDALYRETREKIRRRRESGCICVDMECSAVAALAAFRGKDVFQFFYAADNLGAEEWDARSLSNHAEPEKNDRVAVLALELALHIACETN